VRRHVTPPSSVRTIVFDAPLAQATLSFTALTPRNRAVTPDVCRVHSGTATAASITSETNTVFMGLT
jgi:hypothetical protein